MKPPAPFRKLTRSAPATDKFMLGPRIDLLLWLISKDLNKLHPADSLRLGKMMFLTREGLDEQHLTGWDHPAVGTHGPVARQTYADLQQLEALGFIETQLGGKKCGAELAEYTLLDPSLQAFFHPHRTYTYQLTQQGRRCVARLELSAEHAELMERVRRWHHTGTTHLLRYLYLSYPEYGRPSRWEKAYQQLKRRGVKPAA